MKESTKRRWLMLKTLLINLFFLVLIGLSFKFFGGMFLFGLACGLTIGGFITIRMVFKNKMFKGIRILIKDISDNEMEVV